MWQYPTKNEFADTEGTHLRILPQTSRSKVPTGTKTGTTLDTERAGRFDTANRKDFRSISHYPQRVGGPPLVTPALPPCHHAYMVREELRCGEKYGFRERPRSEDVSLQCIQLLKHIRGRKWQVRWIDTHPGLVDYIDSAQILIPWGERKAFLQEERDREAMSQRNDDVGFQPGSALSEAIHDVFENIGDSGHFDINHGSMSGSIEVIERLRVRAKLSGQPRSRRLTNSC
jgi:hypothetical protein